MQDSNRREWESLYRRYLQACNDHDFDRLGEFVAERVVVNGEVQGLSAYAAGLTDVVRAFPDYRWNLHHLLVERPWISAHFVDTGTHQDEFLGVAATKKFVRVQEFALYRMAAGMIAEVWVSADNLGLLTQLRQPGDA